MHYLPVSVRGGGTDWAGRAMTVKARELLEPGSMTGKIALAV
jgi:hypothetical protein